jgi:lipopolysaccharide/colanic/teichoic acid biosynthesis glycosyltransferase
MKSVIVTKIPAQRRGSPPDRPPAATHGPAGTGPASRPAGTAEPGQPAGPATRAHALPGPCAAAPGPARRSFAVRAWMVVLPVDGAALITPAIWWPQHFKALVCMAAVVLALMTNGGRYRARLHVDFLDECPSLIAKMLTAAAVVATVTALRHEQDSVTSFLNVAVVAMATLLAGRLVTGRLILLARRRRWVRHPTLLVGDGPVGRELTAILDKCPQYGLQVLGYVSAADPEPGRPDQDLGTSAGVGPPEPLRQGPLRQGPLRQGPLRQGPLRLGPLEAIDEVVGRLRAEVVLVVDGDLAEGRLLELIRRPACQDSDLLVIPRFPQFHTQHHTCDHIGAIPVMRIRNPPLHGVAWTVKRLFDIVVSAAALIVLSPVLTLCALAVRLEGGPGVLFRQERVGRDGQVFQLIKFRSLKPADDREAATLWSVGHDGRVGAVGRFIRRTSLDELPQFWNILRGDMTLVGPRPERPHFVEKFSAEHPRYRYRHRVPTGLTGLAQVSGLRGDTPIADRARYDNYYIETWSLWLDVKVLLRTVGEVLFARGR